VHFYNRRQGIEAGIKEFKGVFYMGHMRFFDPEAIQIQEQLITFLLNLAKSGPDCAFTTLRSRC